MLARLSLWYWGVKLCPLEPSAAPEQLNQGADVGDEEEMLQKSSLYLVLELLPFLIILLWIQK